MAYAWIITKDHLHDLFQDEPDTWDETGTCGPSDAPDDMLERVKQGEGHMFRMYDDDQVLYYTGRLVTDVDMLDVCDAPLVDFGAPNAGAVDIRWDGHSEWDCG